jgi:hypothetical protein
VGKLEKEVNDELCTAEADCKTLAFLATDPPVLATSIPGLFKHSLSRLVIRRLRAAIPELLMIAENVTLAFRVLQKFNLALDSSAHALALRHCACFCDSDSTIQLFAEGGDCLRLRVLCAFRSRHCGA